MPAPLRRRRLMAEINVVPYIDVMLVLLIIFMITAPLLKEGVKVDLPDAGAKPLDADLLAKHQPLVVTIDARGPFVHQFWPEPGSARIGSDRQRAHGGAPAPRSANPGAGAGRYHGGLWHRGARHGAAAASRRYQGGISDRPGTDEAAGAHRAQWSRQRRALNAGLSARTLLVDRIFRPAARAAGGGAGVRDADFHQPLDAHQGAPAHRCRGHRLAGTARGAA